MDDREIIDLDDDLMNAKSLPNSTAVLVLGIVSIVMCWTLGIIGLACSIIALILFKKDNARYKATPNKYTLASYKNMKAGQVCAIIGLCLSALVFLYYLFAFIILGGILSTAASSGAFDSY